MSDVDGTGCAETQAAAAELALGLLTGAERAAALAHLERCAACRAEVAALTDVGEAFLALVPEVTPSPGFEDEVVARIGELREPPPTPAAADAVDAAEGRSAVAGTRRAPSEPASGPGTAPESEPRTVRPWSGSGSVPAPALEPGSGSARSGPGSGSIARSGPAGRTGRLGRAGRTGPAATRRHRPLVVGAAAAAAVVLVAVAGLTGVWRGEDPTMPVAIMRTGEGEVVGEATLHGGDRPAIELDLGTWEARLDGDDRYAGGRPDPSGYWLAVDMADGHRERLPLSLDEDGPWRLPLAGAAVASTEAVEAVAVVDGRGRTRCSGSFS